MKKDKALELRRQAFHILLGLAIIALFYYNVIGKIILLGILVACILLSALSKKVKIPIASWFLEKFERPETLKRFPNKGTIYFLIGSLLVIAVFPRDIAFASIAILAFGDSISHLVGKFWGRNKHPLNNRILIEGSIAGTIAGFLGAMLFVSPLEAFIAAFVAMIIESIELKISNTTVDDNIVIPVVAGAIIFLLRMI